MRNADMTAVADTLDRLSMWLRREVRHGFSATTITTLDTLLARGPMRISELADREAMTQPGMTILVNRLEAAGQAERIADPTDGRATLVRITDLGKAVLRERHAARTKRLQDELQHLDDADRAALAAAAPAIARLVTRTGQKVSA